MDQDKEQIDDTGSTTNTTSVDDSVVPGGDDLFKLNLPPETPEDTTYIDDIIDTPEDVSRETSSENLDPTPEELDPESYRGQLDNKGNPYQPDTHKFPPALTQGGVWRKRRGGGAAKPNPENPADNEYRRAAESLALLYAMGHPVLLGSEASLESASDIIPLTDSLERLMAVRGLMDVPPEIGVILSASNYTMGVIRRPTVAERVSTWWGKVKSKHKEARNKRAGAKAKATEEAR